MLYLGLDIGGTKTELAILSFPEPGRHQEIIRQRLASQRLAGYESYLKDLIRFIKDCLNTAQVSIDSIAGVGLSLPGSVDPKTMVMIYGNTMMLEGKDLRDDLIKALGLSCPVVATNDALCFTIAEAFAVQSFGSHAKPKYGSVAGIILGTGVGGGLVIEGKPFFGQRGASCEWGHVPLIRGGLSCYCGSEGCAEMYLSGPSLEGAYNGRRYSQIATPQTATQIFALAAEGEPLAHGIVREYRRKLSELIAFIVQICDPSLIVLGGGVSNQNAIYDSLAAEIEPRLFVRRGAPLVVRNKLGDSSGVIGAALLAKEGIAHG